MRSSGGPLSVTPCPYKKGHLDTQAPRKHAVCRGRQRRVVRPGQGTSEMAGTREIAGHVGGGRARGRSQGMPEITSEWHGGPWVRTPGKNCCLSKGPRSPGAGHQRSVPASGGAALRAPGPRPPASRKTYFCWGLWCLVTPPSPHTHTTTVSQPHSPLGSGVPSPWSCEQRPQRE